MTTRSEATTRTAPPKRAHPLCLAVRSPVFEAPPRPRPRWRIPSFPKMRPRCPSTVRSERKSAAATSLFVLPSATSAATRSSAGVSAPGAAARPLMRFSSARARSAQSAAPIPSKTASASSSVARASRRRFSRRCVAPSASSVRPRSSGSSTSACRSSAVANAASAASSSPACAARSPRQRAQLASAETRSEPAGVPFVPVQELASHRGDVRARRVPRRGRRRIGSLRARRSLLAGRMQSATPGARRRRRPLEREGEESESRGCDEDHETGPSASSMTSAAACLAASGRPRCA